MRGRRLKWSFTEESTFFCWLNLKRERRFESRQKIEVPGKFRIWAVLRLAEYLKTWMQVKVARSQERSWPPKSMERTRFC